MMNHHLPAMPLGQPPMSAPRRQQDIPYSAGPPSMRSPPAYMGYPPHMNGHMPAYSPQQYPHWFPAYPQMQPPRPFQPPYAPMFVSSYPPPAQPIMAPAHMPPPTLQPRNSTPLQATMSPSVGSGPAPIAMPTQSPAALPLQYAPSPAVSSPVSASVRVSTPPREPFHPPVGPFTPCFYSGFSRYQFADRAMIQLPWLSVPDHPFPARIPHRRRKGRNLQSSSIDVELPTKGGQQGNRAVEKTEKKGGEVPAQTPSEPHTPALSAAPSVANSTQPTTPSAVPHPPARSQSQPKGSKPAVPVVPVVPVIPGPPTPRQGPTDDADRSPEAPKPTGVAAEADSAISGEANKPSPQATPKSWADLVRSKAMAKGAGTGGAPPVVSNGVVNVKTESMADVLTSLGVDVSQYSDKVAFLEPRGLVNTGNMCYMNSVCRL